jgi:DNA-directed RNA polymerase specialized sigma subunit
MPDLLESEFAEPFKAWKATPGPATNGAMLRAVQPVIDSGVKSYGGGSDSPLLASRARRMVLDALPSYDPTKGPLKVHLDNQLRGLRRIMTRQNQIINVPEQVQLDQHHLFESENRLRDMLGRDPTDLELADETGLSPKRLAYIRKANGGIPEGALDQVSDEGGDGISPAIVNSDDEAWNQFVHSSLPPTDQLVMEWTLGLNGRKKLPSTLIAQKLGVTPAAVSQRKARIQSLLDQRKSLGVL